MKRGSFALFSAVMIVLVVLYVFCYLLLSGCFSFNAWTGSGEDREFVLLREAKQKNADVYAWIKVAGTRVNYPLLWQGEDNRFYLYHDAEKQPSSYGAIFMENYNRPDFSDPFSVVYGHAMRDGAMFGSLRALQNPGFLQEHKAITLWLLDGSKRSYEIVSVQVADDEHLFSKYDLRDEVKVKEYYQNLVENTDSTQAGSYVTKSNVAKSSQVDKSSRVAGDKPIQMLVLSTCEGDLGEQRLLVQAVLKKVVTR